MTRLKLSSSTRVDLRKSETKKIRREGGIPATVYGRGQDPKSVAIKAEELAAILKTPGGRLSLIDLELDGKVSKAHPVLIQELQREPVSKSILHVDFHRVSMDEPVHAQVPVMLIGEAPGVKQGGILEQVTSSLDLKVLPDNMPTHIDVDITGLELGDSIHVSEVGIPEGAEVLHPQADTMVATVRMPTVRTEEITPAEAEVEATPAEEAPAE
ncbi:MAG: 50S ribosomal protein L25 [Armatimonadota bacterium]